MQPRLTGLAAHLCGDHARAIMDGRDPETPIALSPFTRLQINHAQPIVSKIEAYQHKTGIACIAQCGTATFPVDDAIGWLFDRSGGRGQAADAFPTYPGRFIGYAGGITPSSARSVVTRINASGPYWLDMESGVRTDDWFDLTLVRAVCREVWG